MTGVLQIDVRAFAPEDAEAIGKAILAESSELVNELSQIAREDATRFAIEDARQAEVRLKKMRVLIRNFRVQNQIIDPEADVESQMGVVSALQAELASSLVEQATLRDFVQGGDQRLVNLGRKIAAIRAQIAIEREDMSVEGSGQSLSQIIGEYEELLVDLEFAQKPGVKAGTLPFTFRRRKPKKACILNASSYRGCCLHFVLRVGVSVL